MTFGECMAVLYPPDPVQIDDAPLLKWDIGGAEANCAIALARLGISVRWHSRVGNDPFGRKMISILAGEGVDTSAVAIDATKPTGVFFREWLPDGMRRVFYYRAGSAARGKSYIHTLHLTDLNSLNSELREVGSYLLGHRR
jgi:2-dehydro-3-deoxygluconokinase